MNMGLRRTRNWQTNRLGAGRKQKPVIMISAAARDGDAAFLHRFKQGTWCFGRGTVDFVGVQNVGKNPPGLELKSLATFGRLGHDVGACHIPGQQNAREPAARKMNAQP